MSSSSLTLNGIALNTLTDQQLTRLCLKYSIIQQSESGTITKDQLLKEIKSFLTYKMTKYKGRRRSMSEPTIHQPTTNHTDKVIINPPRERRMSQPSAL